MADKGSEPPFKINELFRQKFPDNFKAVKHFLEFSGEKDSESFGRPAFEKRCYSLGLTPDSLELSDHMSHHLIPNDVMMNLKQHEELRYVYSLYQ